jgi:hypothetical protein
MKRCLSLLAILFVTACGKISVAPEATSGNGAIGQVRSPVAAVEALSDVRARVTSLCGKLQIADENMRANFLGRTFNLRTERADCARASLGSSDSAAVLGLQSDKLVYVAGSTSTQVETHLEGRMAILCKALSTGLRSPHYVGTTAMYYSVIPCPSNARLTCVTIETGIRNEAGNYLIQLVDEYAVENNASAGSLIGMVRSHRRSGQGSCTVIGEAETTVVSLLSVQ